MNKGYLYILINPTLPGNLLKIGKSPRVPKRADKNNFPSDVPYIAYDIEVSDCDKAESLVNNILKKYRHSNYRDFYSVSLNKAIEIVEKTVRNLEKIEFYKKAIDIAPDNAAFHNNLGCIYDRLNNHTSAINAYKKAIEIEPDNAVFYNNLGCNYGKLRLYRKAIDAFKESIRVQPDFVKSYFDLGFSYGQLGVHREAVKAFKEAIQVNPNIAQIHYNLGYSYNKLDLHEEAVNSFKNAVRINPEHINAHYNLGIKYLNMNEKNKALKQCKVLKELDRDKAKDLFRMIYRQYRKKK